MSTQSPCGDSSNLGDALLGLLSWHARNTRGGHVDPGWIQADSTGARASMLGGESDAKTEDAQSYMLCDARGREDGKAMDAGGSVLGGFFGGFLLGLIGTAIAVIAQGEPEPPAMAV